MRRTITAAVTAALLVSSVPAGAASLSAGAAQSLAPQSGPAEQVQFRDERRELRREREDLRDARRFGSARDVRRERRDVREARQDLRDERRYYNRGGRRYYRDSNGAEIFAGVIGGLAIGGLIAGAAAADAQRGDAVEYCESRYRSYDRRTGTFLANDGRRYACP